MTIDYTPQWSNHSDSLPLTDAGSSSSSEVKTPVKKTAQVDQEIPLLSLAGSQTSFSLPIGLPVLTAPDHLRVGPLPVKEVLNHALQAADEMLQEGSSLLQADSIKGKARGAGRKIQITDQNSLAIFMGVLGKALNELKQTQRAIEHHEAGNKRALIQALLRLSEIHGQRGSSAMEKTDLAIQLQDLRQNGTQPFMGGLGIALDKRPDLVIRLVRHGIIPRTKDFDYDPMATLAAANGTPPYDSPLFTMLANALPPGWEIVSESEMDLILSQLQELILADQKRLPFNQIGILAPLISLSYAGLITPISLGETSVPQLLEARSQLEHLKSHGLRSISTGPRVILGEHPQLMMQLLSLGITLPAIGGGPYDGTTKKQAALGAGPYSNPLLAAMAKSLPSGWEELSVAEVEATIAQLDEKIERALTGNWQPFSLSESKFSLLPGLNTPYSLISSSLSALPFSSFTDVLLKNWSAYQRLDERESAASNPRQSQTAQRQEAQDEAAGQSRPSNEAQLSRGWVNSDPFLDLLMIKVVIHQALGFVMLYQINPAINPFDFGLQMLNRWLTADLAHSLVNQSEGSSQLTPTERSLMAHSLISFSLLIAIANAQPALSFKGLMQVLKAIELKGGDPDFIFYAAAAQAIAQGSQQNSGQTDSSTAIRQLIRQLAAKDEQEDDQLENLRQLEQLLLEMMKKLVQILGVAGMDPVKADPEETEGSPPYLIQG